MNAEQSIVAAYLALLRSYPPGYQQAYGDELEYAVRQAACAAAREGKLALLSLAWRELRDFPHAVLSAHWRERRGKMIRTRPGTYLPGGPLDWRMLLAVFTPFLLAILMADVSSSVWQLPQWIGWLAVVLTYLVIGLLILTWIVGLIKGLPDWSLPGIGLGLFVLLYLLDGGSGRVLDFFRFPDRWWDASQPRILFGVTRDLLFLLPVAVMALILLLASRSFFRRVRQDWSLLSFLFLGVVIPPFVMNDPYQHLAPFEIAALLILAGGAWIFLKARTRGGRLAVLLLAVALASATYAVGIYWAYPLEEWSARTTFPRWWEAIGPLMAAPAALLLVAAPALLGLLPKAEPKGEPQGA